MLHFPCQSLFLSFFLWLFVSFIRHVLRHRNTIFWLFFFCMTGLLNPKSSGKGHFFFHDPHCIPRPWEFSLGSIFLFLQLSYWERSQGPKISEKTWCTCIVARVTFVFFLFIFSPPVFCPLTCFFFLRDRFSGGLRPFAAFIRGLLDYMQGFTHNQV